MSTDDVLALFLDYVGLSVADLTADEVSRLKDAVMWLPMRRVTADDVERGDVDACDVGEFHTEATGEDRREAWWIGRLPYDDVVEAATRRREAA